MEVERGGRHSTRGFASLAPPPPWWRWERNRQCCTTGHTSLVSQLESLSGGGRGIDSVEQQVTPHWLRYSLSGGGRGIDSVSQQVTHHRLHNLSGGGRVEELPYNRSHLIGFTASLASQPHWLHTSLASPQPQWTVLYNRSHLTGAATASVDSAVQHVTLHWRRHSLSGQCRTTGHTSLAPPQPQWTVSYNRSHLTGAATASVDSFVQQVTPHWRRHSLSGQCRTTGHTSLAPPQPQWTVSYNRSHITGSDTASVHSAVQQVTPHWLRHSFSGQCRTTGHTSLAPTQPQCIVPYNRSHLTGSATASVDSAVQQVTPHWLHSLIGFTPHWLHHSLSGQCCTTGHTSLAPPQSQWTVSYNRSHLTGTATVDSAVQQVTPHWRRHSLSGQCRTTGHTSLAPPQPQ